MAEARVKSFLELASLRRSVYTIQDTDLPLSEEEILETVKKALDISPSPWNISSSCCLVIFKTAHKMVWKEIVHPSMKTALPSDVFPTIEKKIKGLEAGYGTVLFFENKDVWQGLVKSSPQAEPMVTPWSNVVSGMVQYVVWSALSVGGLGCSLQHYDWRPDIVDEIHKAFDLPETWQLKAQLVFGARYAEPGEKPYKPLAKLEDRYKVISDWK